MIESHRMRIVNCVAFVLNAMFFWVENVARIVFGLPFRRLCGYGNVIPLEPQRFSPFEFRNTISLGPHLIIFHVARYLSFLALKVRLTVKRAIKIDGWRHYLAAG